MNVLRWLLGAGAYRALGLMRRDADALARLVSDRRAAERARLVQLADANWRFDRVG